MKKQVATFAVMSLCAALALAQATPAPAPASPLFTASSAAMAIEMNGEYSVASDTTESLNITKSCGISGDELLAPTINLQGYYGGVACTPDLSALLAKTQIPPSSIQFTFKASLGVARNTTPTDAINHISGFGGGCVTYQATPGGGFVAPMCFQYLRAPGFGKDANGFLVSAGLGWVWGH